MTATGQITPAGIFQPTGAISPIADITQSICYFQSDGEILLQRHYLRLLSKASGDAGREPVLVRQAFKELEINLRAVQLLLGHSKLEGVGPVG